MKSLFVGLLFEVVSKECLLVVDLGGNLLLMRLRL